MKRNFILATVAAMSFAAVPAMAQSYGYGGKGKYQPAPTRKAPVRPAPVRPAPVRPTPVRPHVQLPSVTNFSPHAAQPGTTITIWGDNFARGTKVMLNGVALNPSSLTSNKITFVLPLGSNDGSLALVAPYRRGTLAVGSLNVVTPPPPRKGYNRYDDSGWTKTRRSRRARSRSGILGHWNRSFLNSSAVKSELSLHAKRLAQLNRMSRLAKAQGMRGFTLRINVAIRKENARHSAKMSKLETQFRTSYGFRASLY